MLRFELEGLKSSKEDTEAAANAREAAAAAQETQMQALVDSLRLQYQVRDCNQYKQETKHQHHHQTILIVTSTTVSCASLRHPHSCLQELQEDRESFELFHNSKLEAAMEEVKKRTATSDAAATEASALKAQAQCLQEQLAAAMGDCAVSVERCAVLQQQLQVHA